MLALGAATLANGAISACRGWLFWRQGAWIGLNGARLSRTEHPWRFAAEVTSSALLVTIHIGAAGFLAIASAAWF